MPSPEDFNEDIGLGDLHDRASDKQLDAARQQMIKDKSKSDLDLSGINGMGGGGAAQANKYENALASAAALAASIQEKITSQFGSSFDIANAQLDKQVAEWDKQITKMGQAGVDTSGLQAMADQYKTVFTDKITKDNADAWTEAKDQSALLNAQILQDKNAEADAEYQITLRKIEKERLAEIKRIGQTSNDPAAIAQANKDAADKTTLAGQVNVNTKNDNAAKAYQQEINFANELVTLTGATTAQVDAIKEAAYTKEEARLKDLLAKQKQGSDDWYKYSSQLAAVEAQQNQIAATNMETAWSVAFKEIGNQTHNYANDVTQAFNEMNGQITDEFTRMLQGTETFSHGFTNIIQDMANDVIAMLAKMWENQAILGPLQQYLGSIGLGGGSSGAQSAAQVSMSAPLSHFASGGDASGWSLVGEQGPELAYFGNAAHIYTAGQTQQMLGSSSGAATPNVNVTVINKSGQQVSVAQQAAYDPQTHTMVMQMFVEGFQNNIAGVRNLLVGRG